VAACSGFGINRTPDCNAQVNSCMQACSEQPAALEPRSQAVSAGEQTHIPASSCEQRCRNKCR